MRCRPIVPAFVVLILSAACGLAAEPLPEFRRSAWFGEQVREAWLENTVRVLMTAAGDFDPQRPTQLIIYATPNGNSLEQTLGSARTETADWHYDIQHVAAQVRRWRTVNTAQNVVLAVLEPVGLSWPAWNKSQTDGPAKIRLIVETLRSWLPGEPVVTLTGHSGGGSFLFGFIDATEALPDWVDRVLFLDANYSYDDASHHGDKLLTWLQADAQRHLIVIAYDDREITLDGKKVVGPTGGTFRATERMRQRIAKDVELTATTTGPFQTTTALDGQLVLIVHPNPENKILHTTLVGEMNGLLHGLSLGRDVPAWGQFGGPRAYTEFVQSAAGIPPRQAGAIGGTALFAKIADLPRDEREAVLADEILRGNIPERHRQWQTIPAEFTDDKGKMHTVEYRVAPDYLSVGNDADFVRVPMTPQTAQRIADAFGCSLPTRKMVEDITRHATVRLKPQPMTKDREAASVFLQHHRLIEEQWGDQPRGLVAGIKKDIVITNRLGERPKRLAIYGWHHPDGQPIQDLTIVHHNGYVDYSHGVRLVHRDVLLDGRPRDVRHVLIDPVLHPLLSDEGPITHASY
ncbi:MAG TPA: hypothetical protein VM165_20485 [Planctomycetaceae bacterium]|nr:hypothetical protein [Planctomycetaceae bacterium]